MVMIWNSEKISDIFNIVYVHTNTDYNYSQKQIINFFFNLHVGGGVQARSPRHFGHWLAYCTCPGWLWWWRNWWNEDWQGKPKYSEKTCPSATFFTTNPTWPDPGANPGRRGGKPHYIVFEVIDYSLAFGKSHKFIISKGIHNKE
jgi:hypothetical protein